MLREIFGRLLGKMDPLETVIYSADPLLVLNGSDQVVYSGATEVEFTPESVQGDKGLAVALAAGVEGWQPRLFVRQRIDYPMTCDPNTRSRGGFTLIGEDELGEPYTWLIGKAADDFILLGSRDRAVVDSITS